MERWIDGQVIGKQAGIQTNEFNASHCDVWRVGKSAKKGFYLSAPCVHHFHELCDNAAEDVDVLALMTQSGITETNRMHLILLGMRNRTGSHSHSNSIFEPYLGPQTGSHSSAHCSQENKTKNKHRHTGAGLP
jgi:hypothetical protein